MSTAEEGSTVSIHYTGTLTDGTEFDTSKGRDPLSFTVGSGQVIPGFNDNVIGMSVGETKTFTITSDQAYGPVNEEAVQTFPRTQFPEDYEIQVGNTVTGTGGNGAPFMAKILSEGAEGVTLDFNHPLAGQDLVFEVEVVSIT